MPLPVLDVIASPLSAPVSTSAQLALVRIVLASVPLDVVSSLVPARVTVAPLVIVAASLTDVTVIDAEAELADEVWADEGVGGERLEAAGAVAEEAEALAWGHFEETGDRFWRAEVWVWAG